MRAVTINFVETPISRFFFLLHQHALDEMRAQLIGQRSYNVGVDLKMRYCQMDSISVINDVLRKYHLLMSAAAYKKLSKKERRYRTTN